MDFVKKYLVGTVSLTDNKASLSLHAEIEEFRKESVNYCDPVFLLSIKPYNAKVVSMKLNNIETRALLKGLAGVAEGALEEYSRQSGGKTSLCHLNIKKRNQYHLIGLVRGSDMVEFSFKEYEMLGFAKEAEILCDTTAHALFKTQQMIDRRKKKS